MWVPAPVRVALPALMLAAVFAAAACQSATSSVVAPSGSKCEISVTNETPEVSASGENGRLSVTASRDCSWSASSQASWISLSTSRGQGEATVSYTVLPNPAGTSRRGRLIVADHTVDVVQAGVPCRFEVSPANVTLDASGGQVSVGLRGPEGCAWTSRSDVSWIGTSAPREGTGSATVRFSVQPNTTQDRTGTVTIADATVRVNQSGPADAPPSPSPSPTPAPPPTPSPTPPPSPGPSPTPTPAPTCSYRLAETTRDVGREPEELTVGVNATSGCAWTVSTDTPWINVVDGQSGSGNGSFRVTIAGNTGESRTGTVRVASETLTIRQAARVCTYSIRPTSYDAGRGPDDIRVTVTANAGCTWTASSGVAWVSVAEGRTGTGSGTVRLLVEPNSGSARSATLTIAGQPFELSQAGGCTYGIKPTYYDAGRGPDNIEIDVTADTGCTWTAASSVSWVTVAQGRTGTGNGQVRLLVEANNGPARSVTLTIAGQPFQLTQGGSCSYGIKPTYYDAGRGPDDIDIDVTADAGCTWTAASPVSWVTVAEGRNGSGNGRVRLLIEANGGAARSVTLTIAGQPFHLTQGGGCASIKPDYYDAGRGPDNILINVTADAGCRWTASSPVSWVSVVEGREGSGNGRVRLAVQPNSGPDRSVTLMIADQPFELRQDGPQ